MAIDGMPRNCYCYVTVDKIVTLSKEKFLYAVFDDMCNVKVLIIKDKVIIESRSRRA